MWHETTFQSWLTADPDRLARLGVGELFFVGNAGRLKRLVDMVFISAEGALVLVEVKNERTTREVIGQALEYAARLQDATLGRGSGRVRRRHAETEALACVVVQALHRLRRTGIRCHVPRDRTLLTTSRW